MMMNNHQDNPVDNHPPPIIDDDDESSIKEDLDLLDKMNIHYDFSAWDSFRKSLSEDKRKIVRRSVNSLIVPFRSGSLLVPFGERIEDELEDEELKEEVETEVESEISSEPSIDDDGDGDHREHQGQGDDGEDLSAASKNTSHKSHSSNTSQHDDVRAIKPTNSSTELTEEERYDIAAWRMRLTVGSVFARDYVPQRWEGKEMEEIIDFLDLKNPVDDPEYLVCMKLYLLYVLDICSSSFLSDKDSIYSLMFAYTG